MSPSPGRATLFALAGMSPAILTETVYALAVRTPPIVPDEIIVVTTGQGKKRLVEQLLTPSPDASAPWNHFALEMMNSGLDPKGRLLNFGEKSIQCVPAKNHSADLKDVVSKEDNVLLADYLLRTLRGIIEEDDSKPVIASIAGGRKTMSALLLSCMSLLARPQDSVCHVLVSPPFENPRLSPTFLFPEPGLTHVLDGKKYPSSAAKIDLMDVPFVKLRGWYLDRHGKPPPSYSKTVEYAQSLFSQRPAESLPSLDFDMREATLSLDGKPVRLSFTQFLALCLFHNKNKLRGAAPWDVMWRLRNDKIPKQKTSSLDWLASYRDRADDEGPQPRFMERDQSRRNFQKVFSELRQKLRTDPVASPYVTALVPDLRKDQSNNAWPENRMSADVRILLDFLPKG